jgi:thiamine transport system substrate-binding protein
VSHARTAAVLLGLSLTTACTVLAEDPDAPDDPGGPEPTRVVLVTHDSFALPTPLLRGFEEESALQLVVRRSGDAGTLTNKLVLTRDSPVGDVAFGVDNTFASRALEEDVFDATEVTLPPGADVHALEEGGDRLVPVDTGSVCVNVDPRWFADRDLAEPVTLDDLLRPEYRDLFVTPGASTSSPGMAFLLSTIAEYGDQWPDYWADLMENGAEITAGWSDAYFVDFTRGGGEGDRPLVLSYDSSPAFTLDEQGRSTTEALLETCFRQVEYAALLEGAENPEGARAVVEFLLGPEVQAALPESMYVFPVRSDVPLPEAWAEHAVRPERTYSVDPREIAEHRDDWLTTWTEVTTR